MKLINSKFKLSSLLLLAPLMAQAAPNPLQLHIPMELSGNYISDIVSGAKGEVKGQFAPDAVAGAIGKGVLFDGYSTRADLPLSNIFADSSSDMTFSLWMAVPCYPIIEIDHNTKEKATVASCLDSDAKKGFGLYLGMDGKLEFRLFTGGWQINVESTRQIQPNEWNHVAAVLNHEDHTLKLYINGQEAGSTRCNGSVEPFTGNLRLGYGEADRMSGPFNLMAFNGILDEIKLTREVATEEYLKSETPENPCDITTPASRFSNQALRPLFHGMPGSNWTNESHGMIKGDDGRYHVFFQKNGNGPYMARLHWGHISSENLFDWREEPIAFAPGTDYDYKGCWSGCVFTDNELSGGKPAALYTAVDYARATIALATAKDASLLDWQKANNNPLINGRPQGLSDDFRDPYFFRNGDKAYVIVGTSKDNKGAATLHEYRNGSFTNDGRTFFTASNADLMGRFWEMPNVTKLGDKWLFTATPLDMSGGVKTIYWTGSINDDGTFAPDAKSAWPRQLELISKDGFGLLSPTIYQDGDKTLMLGIVPDKLPGQVNYELGWAHCYSLPREISLDSEGNLLQRPYSGLTAMRGKSLADMSNFSLSGTQLISDNATSSNAGLHAELLLTAKADSSELGFKIFKGAGGQGKVSIDCATSRLLVDFTGLQRHNNDSWSYNGIYTCNLPQQLKKGEDVTLNVFIDGSILDIFINNKWATSIRVFPTASDATGLEAFSTSPIDIKTLSAWQLNSADPSGIDSVTIGEGCADDAIYTPSGLRLPATSLDELPAGIYIVNGKKILK